ncbi:MAG TPA: 3-dehydroquinate synthase [Feifaniaceae bacterium]|nr:3-dehydroquinate synthase [Feifaniaceae bacterium]
MRTVPIRTSRSYDVLIGGGLLKDAGRALLTVQPKCTVALVSDATVDRLYGDAAANFLSEAGYAVERFSFPAGEASKNIHTLSNLLEFMGEKRITRTDCVAALGGGVTGDLAGFAAAVYLRGIRYVQLPTTLLSAVDSSVGGKTGIDLSAGKNLAGAFYQPSLVLCDTDTLYTLPEEVFRDGLSECIKYGVIWDADLFRRFSEPLSGEALEAVIARCVAIKGEIVREDEFELGVRRLLNFGHTAGHAVETCSGYAIPHGHAVAVGMAVVARAAYRRGLCAKDCRDEILWMLGRNALPTRSPYPADALYEAALADKKRRGGSISLIVPREIGRCEALEFPVSEVFSFFNDGMEGDACRQ